MFKLKKFGKKRQEKKRKKKVIAKTKNLKNDYPLIASLKLLDIVGSVVAGDLEEMAQNKDGAVRKVAYTDPITKKSYKGYTVLVISEQDLVDAGLEDPENSSDLGQLSASIRDNAALRSATLPSNVAKGELILIPSKDGIDLLAELPSLSDYKKGFKWGIFPEEIDDHDDKAEVFVSNGRVTISELTEISDGQFPVNIEKFIKKTNDSNDGNEEISPSDELDSDENEVHQDNDSGDSIGFDDDSYDFTDVDDMDDIDGDDIFEDASSLEGTSLNPKSSTNSQGDADNSSADSTDDSTEDVQDNDILSMMMQSDDASTSSDSLDDVDLDDIPDYDSQEKTSPVQTSEPIAVTQKDDETAKEEILTNIGEAQAATHATFHDPDLNITVDDALFKQVFDRQPFKFALQEVSPDDKLGQLANTNRENANSKLQALHEEHYSILYQAFYDRLQNAINLLHKRLDLKNSDTDLGKIYQKLIAERQQALKAVEEQRDELEENERAQYEKRKENFIQSNLPRLKEEFDRENKDKFEQKLVENYQQKLDEIESNYKRQNSELIVQRRKLAVNLINKINATIIKDLGEYASKFYSQEQQQFDLLNAQINDLVNSHYAHENMRLEAKKKVADYNREVERLKLKLNEQTNDSEQAAKQKYAEYQQNLQELDDTYKQREKQLLKGFEDHYRELKQQYESLEQNKNREIDELNERMETQSVNHQHELDRLRAEIKQRDNNSEKTVKHLRFQFAMAAIVVLSCLGFSGFLVYSESKHESRNNSSQPIITNVLPDNTSSSNANSTSKKEQSSSQPKEDKSSEKKEESSSSSSSADQSTKASENSGNKSYTLPDGSTIHPGETKVVNGKTYYLPKNVD